ncbi:hypothetical protein JOM56_007084 [Amanita muscaria]
MAQGSVCERYLHWPNSRYSMHVLAMLQNLSLLFEAALSVLVRNFSFELPDGPETKVVLHRASALPRPTELATESGAVLPLRVRPVDRF